MFKKLMDRIAQDKSTRGLNPNKSLDREIAIENPNIPLDDQQAIVKSERDNAIQEAMDMSAGFSGGVRKFSDIAPEVVRNINPKFLQILKQKITNAADNPDELSKLRSEVNNKELSELIEDMWINARAKFNETMFNQPKPKLELVDSAYNPNFNIEDAGHLNPLKEIDKSSLGGDITQAIEETSTPFTKLTEKLKGKK